MTKKKIESVVVTGDDIVQASLEAAKEAIENPEMWNDQFRRIEPGESVTVGARVFTNTSEQSVHVGMSEGEPLSALDLQRWEALSDLGKVEFARTGVIAARTMVKPVTVGPGAGMSPANMALSLGDIIEDLIAMQHARAAAGNGTATHWQNAQSHIKRAIECIEQQAEADRK